MTRRERWIVWIASIFIAITRVPALSRSLWDWDEALFALALRDYDVRLYHPHPPGFPLFIALAKLIPHHDEFHALQAIVFVGSLFVFPAAFFLARELRASFFVSVAAGVLLAFMPNVWFYGGTALSDVPSMVLSLIASALLLRARRRGVVRASGAPPPKGAPEARTTPSASAPSSSALIAGAILLGIAAGFRPQNLIIAFVPFVLAFRCRRRTAIAGALITIVIIIASYGAAAAASGGWSEYRATLAEHERYIRETDSFLSPIRPSLLRVADDFFVRPYRAPAINAIVTLLVLVALWRRKPHVLTAIAVFGPFCLFAWLYLDFHSASRFSVAYMPLFAILAADGIDATRKARVPILAGLVVLMIAWTWPALWLAHRTASPPVAAIDWIRANVSREQAIVYVDERLAAHAALLLDDYDRRTPIPVPAAVMHERARAVLLQEGRGAVTFTRDRTRLAVLARPRYFETSVTPLPHIQFAEGWYGEEGPLREPWRWMGKRSRMILPRASRVSLRLAVPERTVITIFADGRLVERIDASRGTIEPAFDAAREIVIETSSIVHAPRDARELGLRLDGVTPHPPFATLRAPSPRTRGEGLSR